MNDRTCDNCKHRAYNSYFGTEYCLDYELADDPIACARDCTRYCYEEPEENDYMPSATNGDYSPSCPWNAPGMSVKDFI